MSRLSQTSLPVRWARLKERLRPCLPSVFFIKYFAAATLGAASDFFSFMQLHALTGSVIVSNFFSFILGTTVNLLICKYFVFGRSYNGFKGLISLYVMTCGVVFLVTIYIQFSQEMLGLKVAKLSSFVFSYILNYGIRRFFIFSK